MIARVEYWDNIAGAILFCQVGAEKVRCNDKFIVSPLLTHFEYSLRLFFFQDNKSSSRSEYYSSFEFSF